MCNFCCSLEGYKFIATDTKLALLTEYIAGQAKVTEIPNVDRDFFEFLPVWSHFYETTKNGARGGDRITFHGAGFNDTETVGYRCRFDYYAPSALGIEFIPFLNESDSQAAIAEAGLLDDDLSEGNGGDFQGARRRLLQTGVPQNNETGQGRYYAILNKEYSHTIRSNRVRANDTRVVVCTTPSWGSFFPEATTIVSLERALTRARNPGGELDYDDDDSNRFSSSTEETLLLEGAENTVVPDLSLGEAPAKERYSTIERKNSRVYNLYDFYSVVERIAFYPNNVGENTGDGGSASGNQTVVVVGFGFVRDVPKLYRLRFTPTEPEDLASNLTVSSVNITAHNFTVLSFVTPKFGKYFDAQLTTMEVVAFHPRLYSELSVPLSVAARRKYGELTFYWTRDWSAIAFSTRFGAKGGDHFDFTADGLSFSNSYRCLFTTESSRASFAYAGDMMFSDSVVASSPVNVSCTSPPWGTEFVAQTARLYLIERENGIDRILFNVKGRVPKYNFYESWDAIIPTNASAGGTDTLSISVYGVAWGIRKRNKYTNETNENDSSANYTCRFIGRTNVTSETAPDVVPVEGAGVVPVMDVEGLVLSHRSTTTIRCPLDAWGSFYPAMATTMQLLKGHEFAQSIDAFADDETDDESDDDGIDGESEASSKSAAAYRSYESQGYTIVPEVSYSGGDDFVFDPDWAYFDGTFDNGAKGNEELQFSVAGLNVSSRYECCFTEVLFELERACTNAEVSRPNTLICLTPEWGKDFRGANTTVTVVEATPGTSVATPGRVVPARKFTIVFEEGIFGADVVAIKEPRHVDDTYYLYPAIDVITPSSGTALGHTTVVLSAYGLDPPEYIPDSLNGAPSGYRCRFTYTYRGTSESTEDTVYEELSAPVIADSLTQLTCVTPVWGDKNPGYPAKVSLVSNFTSTTQVKRVEDIRFHFLPKFTSYSVLSFFDQSGAAGGDDILFKGSGFDPLVESLYTCRFSAVSGSSIYLDSVSTTAQSHTNVTCVTPQWGMSYSGMDVIVTLVENTALKSASVAYGSGRGLGTVQPAEGFISFADATYDFFPAFTLLTPAEGSAAGGENLVISTFGLTTGLTGVYLCEWRGARSDNADEQEFVFPTKADVSLTSVTVKTPSWGSSYSASPTFLIFTSTDPDSTGGYSLVRPVGAASTVHRNRVDRTCITYSSADDESTSSEDDDESTSYCGHTFDFIVDWNVYEGVPELLYGAKGGDELIFSASGLDLSSNYLCRFTDGEGHVLDSPYSVAPTSLTSVGCVTPSWGSTYAAAETTLELVGSNGVVQVRSGAVDDTFDFFAAWSEVDPRDGSSAGGVTLTLDVWGLPYGDDFKYKCRFTGSREGQEVETTFKLSDGTLTSFTCVTPSWPYAQDFTILSLITIANTEVTFVGDDQDYVFKAVWTSASSDALYGAMGGDELIFDVSGLDSTRQHFCNFSYDGEGIESTTALPLSSSSFKCTTPM